MTTQDDEGEEWRFSLEDLDDDAGETATDDTGEGNIAGTLERRQPLEPGDIDLENAVFVALGALLVAGLLIGAVLGF